MQILLRLASIWKVGNRLASDNRRPEYCSAPLSVDHHWNRKLCWGKHETLRNGMDQRWAHLHGHSLVLHFLRNTREPQEPHSPLQLKTWKQLGMYNKFTHVGKAISSTTHDSTYFWATMWLISAPYAIYRKLQWLASTRPHRTTSSNRLELGLGGPDENEKGDGSAMSGCVKIE